MRRGATDSTRLIVRSIRLTSCGLSYITSVSKIQAADIKLGGLVKQVVEEQKALKTEQKNAKYLVDTLSKVSKLLTNAQLSGLNENTATEGVAAQLAAIKDRIDAIEDWLKQHSN